MADNENVWTQSIESDELTALLSRATSSGHPEWDYHVRHRLVTGEMSEGEGIDYLEECFDSGPPVDDGGGDDTAKKAPARKTTKS